MSIEFNCPQCGQMVEADESACGHVAACPHCGKGIVVPRGRPKLGTGRKNSTTGNSERSVPASQKPFRPVQAPKVHVAIPERLARPTQDSHMPPAPSRTGSRTRKLLTVLLIVLGVAIIAGVGSYGGWLYFGDDPRLERGISYYQRKAYPKALKLLLPLAKKGYAKAQLYIGDCYANGNGVIMDSEEAVKWYRAAADQELAEAQHRLFVCYRDGVGVKRDSKTAAKFCRKAAEAEHDEAMFDMGMLYANGKGVEENAKSAFKWFRKGAECGYPPALYQFGHCYKVGYGVEKDEDEASKWQNKAVSAWRTSANAGEPYSMILLGLLYQEGDVVETDKEEAVKWYRKAAERDDVLAQFLLAVCYYKGVGIEEDMEEAAKWMLKSAEHGTFRESQLLKRKGYRELLFGGEGGSLAGGAQFAMGRFYQEGSGVEKNPTEAVKWYERAAKRGSKEAKFHLAMCYMKGEGVQLDVVYAETLLEESADAGDEDAKKELDRIRHERAERKRKLAQEKVEKEMKIKRLSGIEDEIEDRKGRINSILKGAFTGSGRSSDWSGFDAGKIALTDASVTVAEESPLKRTSGELSESDSMEKINNFLDMAQKETTRLEKRLQDIARVKNVYDVKELESRKETCAPCEGKGRVKCARCQGSGTVTSAERKECPTCCDSGRKGQVCSQRRCGKCGGSGQITPWCSTCNGKGVVRGSGRDAFGKIRLDTRETCSSCGGSKKGYPISCPGCTGRGEVDVWQSCTTCRGRGFITSGEKETCPVCDGKGDLKCERCDGRGFTYRPKEGEGTQFTNDGEGTTNATNEQNINLGSGRRRRR